MNNKKYVGKGKQAQNGAELVNFSIAESKIKDFFKEHKNGERYLALTIGKMREADMYGNTHTVFIDEFVPSKPQAKQEVVEENADLPF